MIQGNNIFELQGLNDHNSRVYSGLEYIFVSPLKEYEKVNLIKLIRSDMSEDKRTEEGTSLSINQINNLGSVSRKMTIKDEESSENKTDQLEQFHWLVVPVNRNKSKFSSKSQGQFRGKTYSNELSLNVVGSSRITVEFFHKLLNNDFAVIFKDANGNYRLLFDECYPNEIEVSQDTGEGLAAEVGFSVTITNQSKYPALYVYGTFNVESYLNEDPKNDVAHVDTAVDPDLNTTNLFCKSYTRSPIEAI